VVYFAGRPLAVLERVTETEMDGSQSVNENLTWVTTDHLGTPALVTDEAGAVSWSGGFEPFGKDYSNAQGAGVFLRFPGQWDDASWSDASAEPGYYNLFRWYGSQVGSYAREDPVSRSLRKGQLYRYALSNPLRYTDPMGLFTVDSSCDPCINPIRTNDNRSLSDIIRKEVAAACESKLDAIQDVNLRDCIQGSCDNGNIKCSLGEDDDLCSDITVAGYTANAWFHWFRKMGLFEPIRELYICGAFLPNFEGDVGGTAIHEWAHGCGWNPDGVDIPGIPSGEGH
jgi:RHS repeat-associated protein